jgi:hypothetical protein
MSENHLGGNIQNEILREEHNGTINAKRVSIVNSSGQTVDVQLSELIPVLRTLILAIANPAYVDKSSNAIRNTNISGTVDTVTTVTGITSLGTWPAGAFFFNISQDTWANMCRSLIT